MNVVLADIDAAGLESAANDVRSASERRETVLAVQCDVTDPNSVKRLAQQVDARCGVPHVVVANAGVVDVMGRRIWETPIETWRWIYEVNVFGTVHCILAFLPSMMESQRPAHLVATASELGLMSDTDGAAYASTKHAVVRIMEGLHLQLLAARSLVRATLLCPGLTATNLLRSEQHRPARWSEPGRSSEAAVDQHGVAGGLKAVSTAESAPPERVAAALIEALEEDIFYCVTAPEVDSAVKRRMDDILTRRNPRLHPAGVYCGLCGRTRPAACDTCSEFPSD